MNKHNKDTLESADQHQQISLLLPWYLNQSLDITERQQVESHLQCCKPCRRELDDLAKLAVSVKQATDPDVDAESSFSKWRAKLQSGQQQSESSCVSHSDLRIDNHTACLTDNTESGGSFLGIQGKRLGISASALLIVIPLTMQYGRSPTAGDHHNLLDAKPETNPGIHLRVFFSEPKSNIDINALLAKIHGERMAGPNSVDSHAVRLNSGKDAPNLVSAIAFLREQQNVMLAGPVLLP